MEREHDQDRDQSLQPLGLSRDSMRQALTLLKAICFADSAMIMHVVPESAEVFSCGLRNISRVAVQCIIYSGALRLAPIYLCAVRHV